MFRQNLKISFKFAKNCKIAQLEYMPIFKKYSAMIESHLQKRLTEAVPGFDMDAFSKDLLAREDEALAFRRW